MSDETELKEAPEVDAAEEEGSEKVSGGKRLSEAQRKEICDLYSGGKMKVTQLSEKYGVSKSAISQLIKKEGLIWASRVVEEAKAAAAATAGASPPGAPPKATFAEKRQLRIEQTREESYNIIRTLRITAVQKLKEAETLGTPIPTLKETMNVFKRLIDMQINASTHLLHVLEADQHVDIDALPEIHIRDLSDEEVELMTTEDEDADLLVEEEPAS